MYYIICDYEDNFGTWLGDTFRLFNNFCKI